MKAVTAGGKHYIPIDLAASKLMSIAVYDQSHAYEPQYPAYSRLDGRITFQINREKFNTEIAFDVQNLTNHKNIMLESFDPVSSSIKYDYQFGLFYVFLIRIQF